LQTDQAGGDQSNRRGIPAAVGGKVSGRPASERETFLPVA
jgi:hypothetical protein